MSVREWVGATWAEWAPTRSEGRFEIGGLIIMTRPELARLAMRHVVLGAEIEQRTPGAVRMAGRMEQRDRLHLV